ncbi:thiol-disulfide oxidoreductase ResA [Alkalicoccus chagannorensis]|uniref:thiol-disulfide oxidoreductase ResA n=1 Tax=Alkalicoccus chagannorensis TaxID=427072 RepID=UPI0004797E7F|nr:thiol-disulfide oxidoreductase ResA [Alkalicoccus chagannorensis]
MDKKQKRFWMRSSILLVMLAAIGYTFYSHFSEDRGLVDAGDEAPDFVLTDLDGEEVELSDYQGQGVYLNFWATYCTFCRQKMDDLKDHYEDFEERGVHVLNVNVDESTLQVERHKERYELPYDLMIDRDMLVSDAYGVGVLPTTLSINADGEVVNRSVGGKTEEQLVGELESIVPET